MRPTGEKHQTTVHVSNGTEIPIDPRLKDKALSKEEMDIWLDLAGSIAKGFTSNSDLTTNNPPTFISDEIALMADRLLLAYRVRAGKLKK